MKDFNVPIQSLIDHIKTAIDVDPWAKEMAEELLKEQEKPNGKCVNECECWDSAYERGKQDVLKEQEAVEPVKFVRCKNCKHCDSERIDKNMIWCKIHQFGRPDDYYCADGIEK